MPQAKYLDPRFAGISTVRLTASGPINNGEPVVLYGLSMLSGAAAGKAQFYEDSSAVVANRKGGLTGGAAGQWDHLFGMNLDLSQAFIELDANVDEAIVSYKPGLE